MPKAASQIWIELLTHLISVLSSCVHLRYVVDNEALASEWRIYISRGEQERLSQARTPAQPSGTADMDTWEWWYLIFNADLNILFQSQNPECICHVIATMRLLNCKVFKRASFLLFTQEINLCRNNDNAKTWRQLLLLTIFSVPFLLGEFIFKLCIISRVITAATNVTVFKIAFMDKFLQ